MHLCEGRECESVASPVVAPINHQHSTTNELALRFPTYHLLLSVILSGSIRSLLDRGIGDIAREQSFAG